MSVLAYLDPGTGFVVVSVGEWLLGLVLAGAGALALGLRRVLRGPVLLAVLLFAILTVLSWSDSAMPRMQHRVVVLGFDGMSPELVAQWRDRLPNLHRLEYTPLATTNPPQSPVAWSTFATGLHPGNHGLFDFIARDPQSYRLSLTLTRFDAQGRPQPPLNDAKFWHHVPSTILFCPVTFPPDRFDGRMLSGMGTPDVLGTEGTFSYYTSDPEEVRSVQGGQVRALGSVLELNGPRVADWLNRPRQTSQSFPVTRTATGVRVGDHTLQQGQWSAPLPVAFDLGLWRKMHGLVRFLVIETEPHLKIYASPVQYDPRRPYVPVSHPAGYAAEVAEEVGLFPTLGMPVDTWATNEGVLDDAQHEQQAREVFEDRARIYRRELQNTKTGVLMAWFEAPDVASHMFWRLGRDAAPIREAYERCDALVGETLQALGPDDTLLVLSDHGFTDFRRAAHLNTWLRRHGYLKLKDGLAEGRPMFADVDWSATRAYAVGFNGLYVNLQGREGQGSVAPDQRAALVAELQAALEQWTDEGQRVVHRAYADLHQGRRAADAPDLVVGYRPGYRASWQTALGGAPLLPVEDNPLKWSGDHLVDPEFVPGVLFTNRPVTKADPGLQDLAPTILKAAGVEGVPSDGAPLW